ncbi:MAG: SH3 domain-containing protein [Terriglobia bacterium]
MKTLGILAVIVVLGVAYYHYVYAPKQLEAAVETAYVLPDHLNVVDTTAVIRRVVATLHGGQAVKVKARIGEWAKLLLPGGQIGWVKQADLIGAATHEQGEDLLKKVDAMQVQAAGQLDSLARLHLDPSRASLELTTFPQGQQVDVYDRRLTPVTPGAVNGKTDVWYLIRSGNQAGWLLGRFVELDVPPGLANYAQGVNMVAWLVLDTVNDDGHAVPQYIAADRMGDRNVDLTHIRVFTWWIKHHKYVTAYVQSGLSGYFPITVTHIGKVPYFRLRLVDDKGDKYQKIYGLFDTIVIPQGTVAGWTSTAMPQPANSRRSRRRSRWARH